MAKTCRDIYPPLCQIQDCWICFGASYIVKDIETKRNLGVVRCFGDIFGRIKCMSALELMPKSINAAQRGKLKDTR